ncbi:MAG: DUF1573 domain-containing protein [Desulfotomaculales bacterium]
MKDLLCDGFQQTVAQLLLRHRSILDVLSKLQETGARTNRAVAKAVTVCGCLSVNASRQKIPLDASLQNLHHFVDTHLSGNICPSCREAVETEMGSLLFYLAALCNLLNINLYDILVKEQKRLDLLHVYNLT